MFKRDFELLFLVHPIGLLPKFFNFMVKKNVQVGKD